MKLLIADTIFPLGHHLLNEHLLNLLFQNDEISEIKVLNFQNYYANYSEKQRNCNLPFLFKSKKAYLDYLCQFFNSFILIFRCFMVQYDRVIFFTFDTLAFSFLRLGICKPIYLFHHNNTDHLQNKYKRFFFRLYMNHVNHIVFADFIRDYLLSIGVDKSRVYVLPHPLLFSEKNVEPNSLKSNIGDIKVYIALGHANDEVLIRELIAYEYQTNSLEKNHVKLIMRSVTPYNKLPESIEIISGYLSQEKYDYYYKVASGVLILYPESFKNRFSGALLDALKARKIVLGRNIRIVRHFHCEFPECCILFNDIPDLISKLFYNSVLFDDATYEKFLLHYSDDKIKHKLNEILL